MSMQRITHINFSNCGTDALVLISVVLFCILTTTSTTHAAVNWDGEGGSNWWFDPVNWSRDMDEGGPFLPPSNNPTTATDAQINVGSGPAPGDNTGDYNEDGTVNAVDYTLYRDNVDTDLMLPNDPIGGTISTPQYDQWKTNFGNMGGGGGWNVTGEGVVYDPDNDPFFAAAAGLAYPTGSPTEIYVGSDYGPQHIYRIYISRNTTESNLLTIKSGDLVVASTFIIGRSGSTEDAPNHGTIVQTGGRLQVPLTNIEIGQSEDSGWGNGTYDYRGGTLEIATEGGDGVRLGHGRSSGPSGTAEFIMHNPDSGGYVRTWQYITGSYRGSNDGITSELDPNGTTRGVNTTEFHYASGGTRPIQVGSNLTINNGFQQDTAGTISSRLKLVLDDAPVVQDGVPQNLGLFDVDFADFGGMVQGSGDNGGTFFNADGSSLYDEGGTVSADFEGTRYNWLISYSGNISWSDADNSVVDMILGPGTGTDVVLIGDSIQLLGSAAAIPEPASLCLAAVALGSLLCGRRIQR